MTELLLQCQQMEQGFELLNQPMIFKEAFNDSMVLIGDEITLSREPMLQY